MNPPILPLDTARTNAQEVWATPIGAKFPQPMVLGQLARDLERELAAVTNQANDDIDTIMNDHMKLLSENAQLSSDIKQLRACIADALEAYNDADSQGVERRLLRGLEKHLLP